ncbi:Uncharacterised protein [Mycobacterium tuberculosis]|nr:Uncharacterised protein [Mycobacterium tuberculosis]
MGVNQPARMPPRITTGSRIAGIAFHVVSSTSRSGGVRPSPL